MDAGDWVAIYAAAIGTAGLVWQAATYVAAHRPKLKMRFHLTLRAETPEAVEHLASGHAPPGSRWHAELQILNVGQVTAWVERVAVSVTATDNGPTAYWASHEWGLPWALEAGESRTVVVHGEDLGDVGELELMDVMRAHASLASGARFTSEAIEVGDPDRMLVELSTGGVSVIFGESLASWSVRWSDGWGESTVRAAPEPDATDED